MGAVMGFVQIDGIDNVRAVEVQLARASGQVGARAAVVVRHAAHEVEARGKRAAPVDTGALRNSISTDFAFFSIEAEIGPTVGYGAYVELGTSRQAPQPYMFPAGDAVEPGFRAALEQVSDPFGGGGG